jgi:hypothetical protein
LQATLSDAWYWQSIFGTIMAATSGFLVFAIPWSIVAVKDVSWFRKYKIQQGISHLLVTVCDL